MWERIRSMLRKEFVQILRDPRMRMMLFVAPVIQLIVFGYAATNDVRYVTTAVLDNDQSPTSRQLISEFQGSGIFDIVAHPANAYDVQRLMDCGQVRAVVRIDKGFGADVSAGRDASVQVIVDGVDSNTASIVMKYATEIANAFSTRTVKARSLRLTGNQADLSQSVKSTPRAWFNENLESRDFYIPGVIANLVILLTLMLTSMSVVREREIGTMEQIIVTPIRRSEFILGKTLPFALLSLVIVCIVTTVGVFWFDVPIRGSLLLLFGATVLFLLSSTGLGLLISTICQTQQQAVMSTFLIFLPTMLLSGFVFPIDNMPTVIQWFTWINPQRHFLVILRGLFLKGVGVEVVWLELVMLALIGSAVLILASLRFRKTVA